MTELFRAQGIGDATQSLLSFFGERRMTADHGRREYHGDSAIHRVD